MGLEDSKKGKICAFETLGEKGRTGDTKPEM